MSGDKVSNPLQSFWVIGASSGIGLSLVALLLEEKKSVVASARDTLHAQDLQNLRKRYPQTLTLVDMDVSSKNLIDQAFAQVQEHLPKIDVCIYNAGAYEKMKIESWDVAQLEEMNQVNYLGGVYLIDRLVPYFQKQKYGRLVFNISIASYFGLPYGGGYSAPKAALRNLCESLQPELLAQNIELQIINHGFVRTPLTQKNDFEMPQLLEPQDAAQKIYKGMMRKYHFEIKFPFLLTTFLYLLQILPYKISLTLSKKAL